VFYKLIEDYSDIIKDYEVFDLRKFGTASSLVAKIEFIDTSILYIKDYLFRDGKRKYSFQWQTSEGLLISRWDNSPHHDDISTFPHHRHLPQEVEEVTKSYSRNLSDVIKIINGIIIKKSSK
jgi:hypothetical protein